MLTHDLENDPDVVSLIGASAALTLSGLPFLGPLGACRVGYVDGAYVLNPPLDEMSASRLDLVVAGTQEGVLMVESEASELSEEAMLGAVMFGHRAYQDVIGAIIALAEACAGEPRDIPPPPEGRDALVLRVREAAEADLRAAYGGVRQAGAPGAPRPGARPDRPGHRRRGGPRRGARRLGGARGPEGPGEGHRPPRHPAHGPAHRRARHPHRPPHRLRGGILPRTHGSALFTRGETQALAVATLGTGQDEQIMDFLEGEYREHFLLHYNFPPYSVGEASFLRSPGRREIGHGKLAWRAVHPLLPDKEEFPYTIRVVSEITESNGSSSMASVCGASLALMTRAFPCHDRWPASPWA